MAKHNLIIIPLLILALGGLVYSFILFVTSGTNTQLVQTPQNFQQALESELTDKCQTPPGYTDEDWKDHMSHHPDRYQECLK